MRKSLFIIGLGVGLLAACSGERVLAPSTPEAPSIPDLTGQAFHVVMDATTGTVEVDPPSPAARTARANGPSFSLIGSDGVDVLALPGECVPIPANLKMKRCSFDLELRNRMFTTDLLTPTRFPRPPQGVSGVLVFPWTATALGGAGGVAVPSPDWDHGPADFFNDFNGCSSGGKSDCYRYELFAAPLYADQRTDSQQVGYDIPASATGVSAYIVVAADLRDNRPSRDVLYGVRELCGNVTDDGDVFPDAGRLVVNSFESAFCSFPNNRTNVFPPDQWIVVSATLRLYRANDAFWGSVEQVDYGDALDPSDFDAPAIRAYGSLVNTDSEFEEKDVTPTVRAGLEQGLPYFQFRIVAGEGQQVSALFKGTFTDAASGPAPHGPELVVQYKRR